MPARFPNRDYSGGVVDLTDHVFVTVMIAITLISVWLVLICLAKYRRTNRSCIMKPEKADHTGSKRHFSFFTMCSNLCHVLIYPQELDKMFKEVDREAVAAETDIPFSRATVRREQLLYEKWLPKSGSAPKCIATPGSQMTRKSWDLVPNANALCNFNGRIRNLTTSINELDSQPSASYISKPKNVELVKYHGKIKHKSRKNYLLVRKYKRYLMYIRRISSADSADLVILNTQTLQKSVSGRIPTNDVSSTLESPWVRPARAMDEKSGISWRTNSSISSVRNKISLNISPKAHDPVDIIADLFVLPERVILDKPILEGTFGKIFRARLRIPADRKRFRPDYWSPVLVKTVTSQAKAEQIRVFLEDAVKLAGIRHKQVANVLASTQLRQSGLGENGCPETIPVLIYPHYEYGILKNFLRKTVAGGSDEHSAVVLTVDQLVSMGLQILGAVTHLHEMNIIHKDIATRNCLLDLHFSVVLSDSALSRDLFPEDYHCLGDNTNRPIKWLAIEALVERKFSTATDVWSFGITMWELITKGQQPYDMFDPFEMPNILCAGYRLRQPLNCPDSLWNIVEACWRMPPSSRPSIDRLRKKLAAFKKTIDGFI